MTDANFSYEAGPDVEEGPAYYEGHRILHTVCNTQVQAIGNVFFCPNCRTDALNLRIERDFPIGNCSMPPRLDYL